VGSSPRGAPITEGVGRLTTTSVKERSRGEKVEGGGEEIREGTARKTGASRCCLRIERKPISCYGIVPRKGERGWGE